MLPNTLPALIALKRILRVKRRHDTPHLHQASENVKAVVGRSQQLNVLHHGARTAGAELKQVCLVAVAAHVPSQVGAAVTDRQVSQDARRPVGIGVPTVHVTLLSRDVDHAFHQVFARTHPACEAWRIGEGEVEVQGVGLGGTAQRQAAPHPTHIKPHRTVQGISQEGKLNGASGRALGVQERPLDTINAPGIVV